MTFFPAVELFDRLAIAELKFEKTQTNSEELEWYSAECAKFDQASVTEEYAKLKEIHSQIWNLESELKSFNEAVLSLEEIGRRAIAIRNLNHERIQYKNKIAEMLNCPVRETKSEHLSE